MSDATNASPRKTFELLLDRMTALAAFRHLMVIVVLLAVWLTLAPYTSLKPDDFESTGAGPINYIVFGLMAFLAVVFVPHLGALATTLTPATVMLLMWLLVTSVLSTSPSLSITRLALAGFSFVLAAALPLLAKSEATFSNCLAIAGGTLLALCYFGVFFMPDVSIHSAYDIVEPHLAGSWRGTFAHKNSAAPVMAMLVFLGLHIWRSGNPLGGALMAAGAAVFLVFSGGKSATALCFYTIGASFFLVRLASLRALVVAIACSLAVLNLTSIGSVLFPSLDRFLDILPIDSSFTGRSEIWLFVLEAISIRPLLGYGFAAFWNAPASAALQTENPGDSTWAILASHSHNGYLDLTVTTGIPGLMLCLAVFIYKPLKDYAAARALHPGDSLLLLLLQMWFFSVHLASMETVFLYRIDPSWFSFLLAMFGLHYLARFPSRDEAMLHG